VSAPASYDTKERVRQAIDIVDLVGSYVQLRRQGVQVRRAVRQIAPGEGRFDDDAVVGEIGPNTQWHAALEGVDAVVHLAARAHVMQDTVRGSLEDYRRVNVEGTRRLALEAAGAATLLLDDTGPTVRFKKYPITQAELRTSHLTRAVPPRRSADRQQCKAIGERPRREIP